MGVQGTSSCSLGPGQFEPGTWASAAAQPAWLLYPPMQEQGAWVWDSYPSQSSVASPFLPPRGQALLALSSPLAGGLTAVIYTDALQTLVMVAGAVILTIKGEGRGPIHVAGPHVGTGSGCPHKARLWGPQPPASLP